MGSDSDLPIMKEASEVLNVFEIPYEIKIVSAHRTPQYMFDFALNAESRGIKVIIAGAGGSAHLPGMVASLTTLPVIGVPIKSSSSIIGIDSLLSIVQMPPGIPVATMAINGAKNAGILAGLILSINSEKLRSKIKQFKKQIEEKVLSKDKDLERQIFETKSKDTNHENKN
jgi:5-(carboxyamino)imidazole ribonucleotide mutase